MRNQPIPTLLALALAVSLFGCGGGSPDGGPMTTDDASISDSDASTTTDAGAADAGAATGIDWNTASMASISGAHIRRLTWLPGQYAYRDSGGLLWRYTPGDAPPSQLWGADAVDRAALDWEILP